jgi:WD40 repeat protein
MKNIRYIILLCCLLLSSSVNALEAVAYAVSEDKNQLAIAYDDYVIRLYSLKSGELTHQFDEHDSDVEFIAFNKKGTKLMLADYDDEKYVINLKDGKVSSELNIFQKMLNDFVLPVNNGDKVQSANGDTWTIEGNKIVIHDKHNEEKAKVTFKKLDVYNISNISLSPNGELASVLMELTRNRSLVLVLDTKSYRVAQSIKAQSQYVAKLEFLNNQTLLLQSGYPVEVWDVNNKTLKFNIARNGSNINTSYQELMKEAYVPYTAYGSINGIDVNSDGNLIITGGKTFEIDINGQLVQVYINNYGPGYDARYSPDGSMAAFAFHGEHLMVYDTTSNTLLKEYDLGGVPDGARIIKYSQSGNYLAAGSDGNELTIIDVEKQDVVKLMDFPAGIYSLQWIDDNTILVGTMLELYLVDLKKQTKESIVEAGVTALDAYFSNSNQLEYIAVGQYGGNLLVLDKYFRVIKQNQINDVIRVQFDKGGNKLVAASESGVFVWSIHEDSSCAIKTEDESIWGMALDTKNNIIYSGGERGVVYQNDMMCNELE